MTYKKPTAMVMFIVATVFITAANIQTKGKFKNLQVLPADISEKKLDSIMDSYNRALNVNCDFCHKPEKNPFSITPNADTIDFAKDWPMKDNARRMIRLMIDINKNYFYFDQNTRPEYLNAVSCNTCHRGNPYPLNK
ncbi:MAG: c-type cytochrome [Ferruginibacter sp.]